MSDMKVRVGDDFYYPDVLVSCTAGGHDYYETAPVLVIEVLSPATERQDRLEKRLAYQRLPSLKEYVLIAQDKCRRKSIDLSKVAGSWSDTGRTTSSPGIHGYDHPPGGDTRM